MIQLIQVYPPSCPFPTQQQQDKLLKVSKTLFKCWLLAWNWTWSVKCVYACISTHVQKNASTLIQCNLYLLKYEIIYWCLCNTLNVFTLRDIIWSVIWSKWQINQPVYVDTDFVVDHLLSLCPDYMSVPEKAGWLYIPAVRSKIWEM